VDAAQKGHAFRAKLGFLLLHRLSSSSYPAFVES
jgi:hypothetical protein